MSRESKELYLKDFLFCFLSSKNTFILVVLSDTIVTDIYLKNEDLKKIASMPEAEEVSFFFILVPKCLC